MAASHFVPSMRKTLEMRPRVFSFALSSVALASALVCLSATDKTSPSHASPHTAPPHTSWPGYLGGPDSDQYTALKQINKANVKQLEIAWSYPTGERGNYLFNPIVIDGVMYVLANNNSVVALDAATGKGTLGPSQSGSRRSARHQLLGELRPFRSPPPLRQRGFPHRHRCAHRPDHPVLRR